jgi:hypothetical protein
MLPSEEAEKILTNPVFTVHDGCLLGLCSSVQFVSICFSNEVLYG